MKINTLLVLLTFFPSILIAESQVSETKEIIGSGFFEVNKTREFSINDETVIYLDDTVIDYTLFEIIGSGFKSAFTLVEGVNSTIDTGTVNAIELITNLQGPVTSLTPLEVLEQPVLITGDTVQAIQNSIKLYQSIAVSGYLERNNSLKATRLMENDNLQKWKIRGFASEVNGVDFKIGRLTINRGGEQILNCGNGTANGFNNGALVEVKLMADDGYIVGATIDTLESVECISLNQLPNNTGVIPSVVQGFISQTQGHDFWLDDIKINTSNTTLYENGERGFVDDAINVEVQGILDADSSLLQADVVRFIDSRVEVTFPVYPEDIKIDESITVNGMTFMKTPQSKDNAQILSTGIVEAIQIQILGYIDSNGVAYLSKILNKGAVNLNTVSVRGQVSAIDNPVFSISNFLIDTSNSLIISQGTGVIDIATFFNLIKMGSQIEVKNAQYDLESGQLINANITIKKIQPIRQSITTKEIIGSGIIRGFGTATITATNDWMFASGFE